MAEVTLDAILPDDLSRAVDERLRRLDDDEVVARIWRGDHTVWRDDPTEIRDRLGWLVAPHAAARLAGQARELAEEAAAEGLTHALVLGMGGSSLAPEVFSRILEPAPGMLELTVLDSTHPVALASVERDLPLDRTLFVVSSKSGTTIETTSHLAYFHELVGDGSRFVAITDPGTSLEARATELGFRRVVHGSANVGGRYSAFTAFGLVPAALLGADLAALLASAAEGAASCGGARETSANPGAVLGVIAAEAALRGREKLTLTLPGPIAPLGAWVEQLVAESTGKEGKGIVPVDLEPRADASAFGDDRLFLGMGADVPPEPWVRLPVEDASSLGAAMFVLEFATALAGAVLGINPFDQPDVQAAKDRTNEVLSAGEIPEEPSADLDELFGSVAPGDYVALQAFLPASPETDEALRTARIRIRDRLRVATTVGYGPRYLHSTGQLHKGGPPTGVFVQVVDDPAEDRPVPGAPFTFGRLLRAQAFGDLAALRERGRRVGRVSLEALTRWAGR